MTMATGPFEKPAFHGTPKKEAATKPGSSGKMEKQTAECYPAAGRSNRLNDLRVPYDEAIADSSMLHTKK